MSDCFPLCNQFKVCLFKYNIFQRVTEREYIDIQAVTKHAYTPTLRIETAESDS